MFEMNEYLKNIYDALQDKDTERLKEIGVFVETDDQYDYETHDTREINFAVAEYIESEDEQSRKHAIQLIDEFDVENKYDHYAAV